MASGGTEQGVAVFSQQGSAPRGASPDHGAHAGLEERGPEPPYPPTPLSLCLHYHPTYISLCPRYRPTDIYLWVYPDTAHGAHAGPEERGPVPPVSLSPPISLSLYYHPTRIYLPTTPIALCLWPYAYHVYSRYSPTPTQPMARMQDWKKEVLKHPYADLPASWRSALKSRRSRPLLRLCGTMAVGTVRHCVLQGKMAVGSVRHCLPRGIENGGGNCTGVCALAGTKCTALTHRCPLNR
eukprot:3931689-Rhodomonas_salina.1